MPGYRARLWKRAALGAAGSLLVCAAAACGPSDAEIKKAVDSVTSRPDSAAAGAAGAPTDTVGAPRADSAARDTAARTPAKQP